MTVPTTNLPQVLVLPEADAQAVLLVRAVEEADPDGRLLATAERARATARAREEASFEPFLRLRALELTSRIDEGQPLLRRLRTAARADWQAPWIVLAIFVLGLATNLLGPEKRINVVANPLAALIVWNVAIYLVLAFAALRTRVVPSDDGEPSRLVRLTSWLAGARAGRSGGSAHEGVGAAAHAFLERWNRCAAALLAMRARRVLHTGAWAMVAGALVGMYARGLLFEYRATWESTFLDASTVGGWLGALLGPASLVSGIGLPEVAAIEVPRDGDAAPWIHLYAMTTGLVVLAPRWVLAATAATRARRLANGLSVDVGDAYYRRLWAQRSGREEHADVLPVSYTLTPPRADRLKALLFDVLGSRARIQVRDALPYGELPPDAGESEAETPAHDGHHVLLFNLAQTPESEVHGRLVRTLAGDEVGAPCLALVDQAAWRERADAATLERRLAERSRTWDRVLREAGLEAVHVNLDRDPPADLIARIEAAWRPGRELAS